MKRRDLLRYLSQHGCHFHHQGGNHEIWVNANLGKRQPIPRHNEVRLGTARSICEKLGLPPPPMR